MKKLIILAILMLFTGLIKSFDNKNLQFEVFFQENDSDPNYIFSSPLRFIIDNDMNMYIVDSKEVVIKKYNSKGEFLLSFGKKGDGPGELRFISNIIITSNKIIVPSYPMINVYDLNGKVINSFQQSFKNAHNLLYDESSDHYISYRIDEETKRFQLSIRKIDDALVSEIASCPADNRVIYGLARPTACYLYEKYVFGINSKSDVIYAFSENFEVFSYSKGKSNLIIKEDAKPLYIPDEKWKKIDGAFAGGLKDGVMKTIKCISPHYYSMIQDLKIDEKDNIWIKALTTDFNGFIKYSPQGKMLGRYIVDDKTNYYQNDWQIKGGFIYHKIYSLEKGLKIYRAKL